MNVSKLTTVVIVTYKGIIIKKTLRSLNKKFRIFIVENSGDKNFKKNIEKKFKNTKVFLTGKNLGFARANNLGLKKVKTTYSLVLNPDVIMSSSQLIKLERVSQTIDFGILTCNCNEILSTLVSYSNKVEKFSINKNIFFKDNKQVVYEIPYVPGWCMFFRTSDLKKVNYFDQNYFLYFEDRDISRKIKLLKKKLLLIKNINIFHKLAGNSRVLKKKEMEKSWHIRFWHFYWSSFYYYRKNFNLFIAIRIHFSKFIRFNYLWFYYWIFGNYNLSQLNKYRANGIWSQFKRNKAKPIPNI